MPTTSNLLQVPGNGQANPFTAKLDRYSGGLAGAVVLLYDRLFSGMTSNKLWATICTDSDGHDGICYVVTAVDGRNSLVYVGKTVRTFRQRYPTGPTGGLKLVFDNYASAFGASISITFYNTSAPALMEGWAYQVALERQAGNPGYQIANITDPS